MTRKPQNISKLRKLIYSGSFLVILALLWQGLYQFEIVSKYVLPSPLQVGKAFITEFPILVRHSGITLFEAFTGLFIALLLGFVIAVLMDSFEFLYRAIYPVLVITQTIPSIAIAPLLMLWLGYSFTPKIALVVITCFFPLSIGFLDGFKNADTDTINLVRVLGGGKRQQFFHVKFPMALPSFFASLKISVSYAVVGAVISEWLGGTGGLGVYMTRVRKSYSYDKMFAVIFLISVISILLMLLVNIIQKKAMPYSEREK